MRRAALVGLAVGMLLAACGGVPEVPGASSAASPQPAASAPASASVATSAAAGASAAASTAAGASTDARPVGDVPLRGTVWQWQATAGADGATNPVSKPSLYTVEFRDDGTIGVRADCNSAGGTHSSDGQNLSIFIGPQTEVACPTGSLSDVFLRDLAKVGGYRLQGGTLDLALQTEGGTMSFVPAP